MGTGCCEFFPSMLAKIHQGAYETASIHKAAHQTRH